MVVMLLRASGATSRPKKMKRESMANALGSASILCSLAVWVEAILHFVPGFPRYDPPFIRWAATLGVAIILAIVAATRGRRLWLLASLWPLATLLLLDYIVGT